MTTISSSCTGTVRHINEAKGYGFISFTTPPEEGSIPASAYFRIKDYRPEHPVVAGQPVQLFKNEPVAFTRAVDPNGSYLRNANGNYTAAQVKSSISRLKGQIHQIIGPDYGLIEPESGGECLFFHFDDVLNLGYFRPSAGEPVAYDVVFNPGRKRSQAVQVKRLDWRASYHPIEGFARIDNLDERLVRLALPAQEEMWDYSDLDPDPEDDTRDAVLPVLKNYLYYTFARAVEQDKIRYSDDQKYACFNTGLMRDDWEPIFAIFERHKNVDLDGREWYLQRWAVPFEARVVHPLPELVTYIDDISKLIWDPRLEIHLNRPHITQDPRNVSRWPGDLQGDGQLFERRALLDAAEKRMRDRLARNYKVAVPQWYKGRSQLLVPLCLRDLARGMSQ